MVLKGLSLLVALAATVVSQALTNKGCYSSLPSFSSQGSYTYQSYSYCQKQCLAQNSPVMGITKGSDCWCGSQLPAASSKVSDSSCSSPCTGYGSQNCGGSSAFTVQLTGLSDNVPVASSTNNNNNDSNDSGRDQSSNTPASSAASSPSPTTTASASVVTRASTIVVTAPGQTRAQQTVITTTEAPQPKSGPNTAGIAAGVVVGVVVLAALAGALFLVLRRRKRRAREEELQQEHVNTYNGLKPSASSAGESMNDTRLDPGVMMQRRQSDGSIADNQDYSRRILKVCLTGLDIVANCRSQIPTDRDGRVLHATTLHGDLGGPISDGVGGGTISALH